MDDRWVIRAVVLFLGLVAVGSLLGGFILAYEEKPIPDFIVGTLGAAVGAVSSLLAKTYIDSRSHPQPVVVTNEADDAVPVGPGDVA